MSTFFASFPDFRYDPSSNKDQEFSRLQKAQAWDPSSPAFREQYKAFRLALVKETGINVDSFFLRYPTFDYQVNASPWVEFSRLMSLRGIPERSSEYLRVKMLFKNIFDNSFNRDIDKFFRGYPGFNYNPRAEPKAEFEKLRGLKGWFFPEWQPQKSPELREYERARGRFFAAFISDFSYFFGVGEDIRDWEYLCDILHIQPTPRSIEACKVALESYYVNIFNLYDHVQRGSSLILHANQQDLTDYSYNNSLVFPQSLAKSTCMKVLLRKFNDMDGLPGNYSSGWSGTITIDKRRRPGNAPG